MDTTTTLDDQTDLEWRQRALCPSVDPDIFFPEQSESAAEAKRICAACPVRPECAEYAIRNDERFGIWGGLSAKERSLLRQATPRRRAPARQAQVELAKWAPQTPDRIR